MRGDVRLPILTGYASRRAVAVRRELMARAKSAHHASAVATDDREKAALRGKAKGLIEAAELVRALERGERLRKRLRNLPTA